MERTSHGDLPDGLRLLRLCADYARAVMSERIRPAQGIRMEDLIPFDLRVELDKAVNVVLTAWDNRSTCERGVN